MKNCTHFVITQFNLRNFPLSDISDYDRWVEWARRKDNFPRITICCHTV